MSLPPPHISSLILQKCQRLFPLSQTWAGCHLQGCLCLIFAHNILSFHSQTPCLIKYILLLRLSSWEFQIVVNDSTGLFMAQLHSWNKYWHSLAIHICWLRLYLAFVFHTLVCAWTTFSAEWEWLCGPQWCSCLTGREEVYLINGSLYWLNIRMTNKNRLGNKLKAPLLSVATFNWLVTFPEAWSPACAH